MADGIEAQIKTTIGCVLAHPDGADEVIAGTLRQSGLEQCRAFEFLIWVPMAFGRAVLEGHDLRLPATFQLMSPARAENDAQTIGG